MYDNTACMGSFPVFIFWLTNFLKLSMELASFNFGGMISPRFGPK